MYLLFRIVAEALVLASGKSGNSLSKTPHNVETVSTLATAFDPSGPSVSPPMSIETSKGIKSHVRNPVA